MTKWHHKCDLGWLHMYVKEQTCEWLYPQGPSGWLGFAECSKCGYRVYEGTIDEREWTCCPHCGARVKAVE